VSRLAAHADFELVQGSRSTLVACSAGRRRARDRPAARAGAARRAREAHGCIYVAAGEITEQAREFAAQKSIRLVHGAELAKLLPR